MHTTEKPKRERAIIIGVLKDGETRWDVEDSLNELALLTDTAGADVTGRVSQVLPKINAATYIGKGKVETLKRLVSEQQTDLVIFDDDLSPVQIRNLEKALNCKLLDRSALILDIFATRAKTAIAKTQVELAQLDYLRTRLTRQWTHLSRQKGGIGTKGPGETQIETDRRLIGNRMATLKDRLEKIDRQRKTQRKGRSTYTRVSLVGYTNAGKSTLMNTLADTNVLAEDRLFATLDATTRTIQLAANKPILLSDTVGFIRKLPHKLIESFKSTLDEVRESDVLLHVVDATHPRFEDHIRVVNETLKELGALEKPTLMVFNKVDALAEKGLLNALREEYNQMAFVSALRGIGLGELRERLIEVIETDYVERVAYIPVKEGKFIAYLRQVADVVDEAYMMAMNGEAANPLPVARLHFRLAQHHDRDLQPQLDRYARLRPVEPWN